MCNNSPARGGKHTDTLQTLQAEGGRGRDTYDETLLYMIKLDDKFTEQFSPNEQLVMLRLLVGADEDGITKISYRAFAKSCGMTLQVCRTTLSNLIKKGEIETETNTALNTRANTVSTFVIICNYDTYRVGKRKLTHEVTQHPTQSVIGVLQAKCKEREKAFENSLIPFVVSRGGIYQPQMIRAFFNYWTERNKSGTKMRFELEKTWETDKRLMTWANNDKKYGKPIGSNRASATDKAASRNALEDIADRILEQH